MFTRNGTFHAHNVGFNELARIGVEFQSNCILDARTFETNDKASSDCNYALSVTADGNLDCRRCSFTGY